MMYRPGAHIVRRAVAPATKPIDLEDVKAHLRVTGSAEDTIIQSYIDTAVEHLDAQGELGLAIIDQTWNESFSRGSGDVPLSMHPAKTLVSVKYFDGDNVENTADLADFALYSGDFWAFIRSSEWPAVYDRPDAITVQYVAGLDEVPEMVKQAIRLTVGEWYENHADAGEASLSEIPTNARSLINLMRGGWYG